MPPTYTLYHGTFIQLPRHIPTGTKPSLEINTGVLWVSNEDGKIDGFDWSLNLDSDEALSSFVQGKGWTIWSDGDAEEGKDTVVVVKGGREGRNGFFFPGFIGMIPYLVH